MNLDLLNINILFFSVDEGAILDCIFENFLHQPPNGFERIMIEKALL